MAFTLQRGFEAVDRIATEIATRAAAMANGRWFRFFITVGDERKIVFLDTNPPVIKEHNLKLNGKYGNHFTCLAQVGQECPLCKAGDRPSDVGFFTILDLTPYTVKNGPDAGKTRTASVKVFAAKFKVLAQLKKFALKYANGGGLVGKVFEVSRSAEKNSPATGDTFIPDGTMDAGEILTLINANRGVDKEGKARPAYKTLEDAMPNWTEYLAPKTAAELEAVAGGKAQEVSSDDAEVDYD